MSPHKLALLLCFGGAATAAALALLKIHGIISVGWLWILAPLWAPVATCVVVYATLLALAVAIMNRIK